MLKYSLISLWLYAVCIVGFGLDGGGFGGGGFAYAATSANNNAPFAFVTIIDGNYKYVARALRMVESIRWNVHNKTMLNENGERRGAANARAAAATAPYDDDSFSSADDDEWDNDDTSSSHTTSQLVETHGAPIFVVNTGELSKAYRREFARFNATVVDITAEWLELDRCGPTEKQLEPYNLIILDADTLVLRSPAEYLDFSCVQAKDTGYGRHLNDRDARILLQEMGRGDALRAWNGVEPRFVYYNTGVLVLPRGAALRRFMRDWLEMSFELYALFKDRARLEELQLSTSRNVWHCEQDAFALAVLIENVQRAAAQANGGKHDDFLCARALPAPLHTVTSNPAMTVERGNPDPIVLHYLHCNTEEGLVRDFPYAGALGHRVALFNARHRKLQNERAARWPDGLPVEKVTDRCKAPEKEG